MYLKQVQSGEDREKEFGNSLIRMITFSFNSVC